MKTPLSHHAPTSRRLLRLIHIKRNAEKLIDEGMATRRAVVTAIDHAKVEEGDRKETEWIVYTAITDPMYGAI